MAEYFRFASLVHALTLVGIQLLTLVHSKSPSLTLPRAHINVLPLKSRPHTPFVSH